MAIILIGNSSSVQFGQENTLLGETQNTKSAEILEIVPIQRKMSEKHFSVINMIDLHEDERHLERVDHVINQLVTENEIQAFIFVVRLGQLTDSDKAGLEWIQRVFGDEVLQFVIILFTYETEEETDTIVDDLKKNPVLEKILEKCGGRYQTCNKKMNNQSEMRELMKKIEDLYEENKEQRYTAEMFNTAARKRKELETLTDSPCHSGQTSEIDPNAKVNFILLGTKQAGKSASGNTILGREAFESKKSSKSVTRDVAVESGDVSGFPVTVYDTPGVSEMSEEEFQQMISDKVFQECESGPCVFLLVIRTDRFTKEDQKTVEKIEKILGEKWLERTWILFTRGDDQEAENMTIQEFIEDNEQLKTLVQKYEQRYHVFNNRKRGSSDQARLLLVKTLQTSLKALDGGRLTRRIPARPNPSDEPDTILSTRRIVLLGKSGVGKSAAGNTILGRIVFESESSMSSVTSECLEKTFIDSNRKVSVVDTPGLFDTQMKPGELKKEIARSVYLSSPGPHAFLIVFRVDDRFTEQEQQIAEQIELIFGQEVLKYSIILFTRGDQQEEPIETSIKNNSRVRTLVQKCGERFHIFNNKDKCNRDQVNDLLKKIDLIIEENDGHYSNEMYEDAQRFRQEEEERRQKVEKKVENKEEKKEDTNITFADSQNRTGFDEFYSKYESRFSFLTFSLGKGNPTVVGAIVGAVIGGFLGCIAGPVGAVVGTTAGATFGGAVGAVVESVASPVGTAVAAVLSAAFGRY